MNKYDVIVVGGGPAGSVAAIAAARTGASVLLIERTGCPGGMATSGLLAFMGPMDNARRNQDDWTRFRLDREGKPYPPELARGTRVVKGIPEEILLSLEKAGMAEIPNFGYIPVNTEALKFLLEKMMIDAGVQILYYSFAAGAAEYSDGVELTLANKAGLQKVKAELVIDATGDGDIAHFLSADCRKGRDADKKMQGVTLVFRLGNVKTDPLDFLPDSQLIQDAKAAADAAFERGEFEFHPGWIGCVSFVPGMQGVITINQQHTFEIDGTSPDDLTKATIRGRQQVQEYARFYKKYVPGCEDSFLLETAGLIGIRETRRVMGDYILTKDDVVTARSFADNICRYSNFLDIHLPSFGDEHDSGTQLAAGTAYGIPYRCLLPAGLSRVITAGRCISATHEALSSMRLMTCCMSIGQAAGTAAAISVNSNIIPRELDVKKLQTQLIADNVII